MSEHALLVGSSRPNSAWRNQNSLLVGKAWKEGNVIDN